MAIVDVRKIHSVIRRNGATGNKQIGAITSFSMPVNATVVRELAAGRVFASSGRIDFTTVEFTFTTLMAERMFNIFPLEGICVTPADPWDVYVSENQCSGPSVGTVHRRYTLSNGMVYLTDANCDHKGDLTVTAKFEAVFDGTIDPVITLDGQTLPTFTAGDEEGRWTLTPLTTTAGSNVLDKKSISIDMGVTTSTEGADSDIFDSFASIDSVLPVVSVTGVQPDWFTTGAGPFKLNIPIEGTTATHANTKVSFRKRLNGGGFVANNLAQHITMTAYGPTYFDQLLSGDGPTPAQASYRIEPMLNPSDSTVPLFWETGKTLT